MTKDLKAIVCGVAILTVSASATIAAPDTCSATAKTTTEKVCPMGGGKMAGPKIGTQTYTFRLFTLFEAIDKAKELGLKYVEMFPGQAMSKDEPGAKVDPDMPLSTIAKIKNKLDNSGVRAIGFGVVTLGKDEAENRKIFDFAKAMGITTITSEPPQDALEGIDKLANEYQINVAIHNHPKPSRYWDADTLLEAVKGRSNRIGACADTGHWVRSGLDPLVCLKKLEGRILWSHFKDLNTKAPDPHDVPWGTGVCDAKALLDELVRQGFNGGLMIEYEHNWENSMPEIAKCIEFFNKNIKCKAEEGKKRTE